MKRVGRGFAGDLRAAVIARRTELGMTATDLQRATGLAARTIRDVESGEGTRRFGTTTLARIDAALHWPTGTAWRTWTGEAPSEESVSVDEEMIAIRARLARIEAEPPWVREWVALGQRLPPDQRALLQALGLQLVTGRDGHGSL